MKTSKLTNLKSEKKREIVFTPIYEWFDLFQRCAWYDFHLIHVYFEYDKMLKALEFSFIVFGLGFYLRWNYDLSVYRALKTQDGKTVDLVEAIREFKEGDKT